MTDAAGAWVVYVLVSERVPRTYVGVARDAERRLQQHNGALPGGAKATRAGRPWRLGAVYGPYPDRGAAQRAELRVKRLPGPLRLSGRSLPSPALRRDEPRPAADRP